MPLPVEDFRIEEVKTLEIAGRRELFADRRLTGILKGSARRCLHRPTPQEIVLLHDAPWEGNTCGYHTIFWDEVYHGGRYRMAYRGSDADPETHEQSHPQLTCYAESEDGIHWVKPALNLVEFQGSRANNVIWDGVGVHNFTPFIDRNPACPPSARYKAVGGQKEVGGLFAFTSPDGIHWSMLSETPIITQGTFDSQNLAFWDAVRGEYRAYVRDFRSDDHAGGEYSGVRAIKTATSPDFLHWSEPVWLDYGDAPATHLYTNQIMPYPRAPHLFIGFPTRFVPDRGALTEGLFMISRDGRTFDRWDEAIIPPGPNPERWHNRSNYIWWGLVPTASSVPGAPPELSIYANEHYYKTGGVRIRRFTYRQDGFVSIRAGFDGGEIITPPLTFEGERLTINAATSAAGEVRVEIQRPDGTPHTGYSLAEAQPFYGDALDHVVQWQGGANIGALAGQTVRLRFALRDADLYAIQVENEE
jgi:hypothetical protein